MLAKLFLNWFKAWKKTTLQSIYAYKIIVWF